MYEAKEETETEKDNTVAEDTGRNACLLKNKQ